MRKVHALACFSLLFAVATIITQVPVSKPPLPYGRGSDKQVSQASRQHLVEAYGRLPLTFEANRGQTDGSVKFLSRGNGYTLFLTATEAVLAEAPDVHASCFDMWVDNYGGTTNPGPEFLREELMRAVPGFRGRLTFLSGNSHDVLPVFFDGAASGELPDYNLLRHFETRPHQFDLITVDGDHTALGAWWDLLDVMPHVALGGAVVFDDLLDKSDELMGDHPASRFANRYPPLVNFRPSAAMRSSKESCSRARSASND